MGLKLWCYPDECKECDLRVFHRHLRLLQLLESLTSEIQEKGAIKWYMGMKISFECMSANEDMGEIQYYFRRSCFTELTEEIISQYTDEGFSKITKPSGEFI